MRYPDVDVQGSQPDDKQLADGQHGKHDDRAFGPNVADWNGHEKNVDGKYDHGDAKEEMEEEHLPEAVIHGPHHARNLAVLATEKFEHGHFLSRQRLLFETQSNIMKKVTLF